MREDLVDRAAALCRGPGRVILGLAGTPGAGKSTVAVELAAALNARGIRTALLPMDGFHLADVSLTRLNRLDRKGAIDTFDGDGYRAMLRRLRAEETHTVYAPGFERTLEQPIAGAIAIEPDVRLVLTEGNYLLAPDPPWSQARNEMAEVWYVETDEQVRLSRLIARHVQFGKPPEAARAWVAAVDEPNARLVSANRLAADLIVSL